MFAQCCARARTTRHEISLTTVISQFMIYSWPREANLHTKWHFFNDNADANNSPEEVSEAGCDSNSSNKTNAYFMQQKILSNYHTTTTKQRGKRADYS